MSTSSPPGAPPWPDEPDDGQSSDPELDTVFATEAVDEAIDVVFAAVQSAQRMLRALPDTAPPGKIRHEWGVHNALVRQSVRLVDERVRQLTRAVNRRRRAS
jgi:hypothetical protein